MLRGVLQIPQEQIAFVLEQVSGLPILSRFEAAGKATADPAGIEISEDELEAVLDALPAPGSLEDPRLMSTRKQLSSYLLSLRQS